MDIKSYNDSSTLQRQIITNMRTFERIIPSQTLQPYLDSRPASTKYALLPIIDLRTNNEPPLIQSATYSQESVYNPGDGAPWSGYASNINNESILRNQIYALQKCSQSVYIPSTKSNLYEHKFKNSYPMKQPHDGLFKDDKLSTTIHNQGNKIGYSMFNNSTRYQLKSLTK
jgi:hypothetical protein